MAATIQHIELPTKPRALDTSGNNNHGKIYSGRALEFDGVTDYLDAGVAFSETNHTVAFWAMSNDNDDTSMIADTRDLNLDGLFVGFNVNNIIQARVNDATTLTSTYSYTNTWVRVVHTYDGTTQKIYINGVLDVSQSVTETLNTTRDVVIGRKNYSPANWFDGYLSDGQFWDAVWTADDVAYDYANPESLALNASGSALTESNLKIWYPMQDGHRGQQSYILDGANTGTGGAEVVLNADFSDNEPADQARLVGGLQFANWNEDANEYADRGLKKFTLIPGGIRCDILEQSENTWNQRIYSDVLSLTEGQSYRFTAEIRATPINLNRFNCWVESASSKDPNPYPEHQHYPGSEFLLVNKVFTYAADTTTEDPNVTGNQVIHLYPSEDMPAGSFWEARNISVKAINDKHHATTVFLGDELIPHTNDRTFAGASNWANAAGDNAFANYDETGSGQLTVTPDDVSDVQYAFLDGAIGDDWEASMIAGRTYRLTYDIHVSAFTKGTLSVGLSTDAVPAVMKAKTDYTATNGTGATATLDFVYVAADHEMITIYAAANTVLTADFDNFSLKEVGVATGWTDADQQLDIAQPALQSYNELAWFDGANDYVPISADVANFGTDNFTISTWVYINNEGIIDSEKYIVARREDANKLWKIAYNYNTDRFIITIKDGAGGPDIIGHSADTALTASMQSKWHHIVCSVDRGGDLNFYVNGSTIYGKSFDISGRSAVDIDNTGVFTIGASSGGGSFFNGCITEVSIFDGIALSSAQVNELYNDGKALDATTHSQAASYLTGYWRNNGLSTWSNLDNPGTVDGTPTNFTETLLIPQGVDGSRDAQGFIMNKARNTSSLNFPVDKSLQTPSLDTGSFVEVNDHSGLTFGTGNFSMECWVKPSYRYKGSSSINTIFTLGGQVNDVDSAGLSTSSGSLITYIGGVQVGYGYSTNDWHHVVATRESIGESEDIKLYINSVKRATGTSVADPSGSPVTGTNLNNAHNMTIGAEYNITRGYEDAVDGIKVYNKALSLAEVQRNYKATKGSHR